MTGFHPFLQINQRAVLQVFLVVLVHIFVGFQVIFEMLQKGHFFLQFFGVVRKGVLVDHVLPIIEFPFHVFKIMEFGVRHDFGGVIEEDPAAAVAQQVAQAVLGTVVNPPFDEDFVLDLALAFLLGIGDTL